ncbi:MAG TPA: 50S ribosomal protein L24 [Candidatus Paceibacterota bacterium]|jgi:large subunit ribosomal protein L24|nr:50S ribosomal protein L24 [Candidatus Paceibacterota bacterium]HQI25803.1 50S ribosomal protein L24 [Candidatus Paceibacterota bacterium]HQJ83704.1 50S ribosomal protein L24 [Candidatus Paceibacterota bacterium]
MKLKKNDNVIVIAGKDKGKKGKIVRIFPVDGRVIVEGLNLRKKRQRPKKQGEKGQTLEMAHPLEVSNVQLFCASCGKGVRVGAKIGGKKKIRICRGCGKEI